MQPRTLACSLLIAACSQSPAQGSDDDGTGGSTGSLGASTSVAADATTTWADPSGAASTGADAGATDSSGATSAADGSDGTTGGEPEPWNGLGPGPVEPTDAGLGTLFAAPDGSGDACTEMAPCAFVTAMSRIAAGDVLFLFGGNYAIEENIYFPGGDADNPATIESYPGQWAILDGSANEPGADVILRVTGAWNRIRLLEIQNMPQEGIWIGGNDNLLEGLEIHHSILSGIANFSPYEEYPYGAFGSRNTIRHCTVHDNSAAGYPEFADGGNSDGMSISSGEGVTIENCLSYANSDDGFDTWRSTNTTIRRSISHDNGIASGNGQGFKAGGYAPAAGAAVENSIAYHNRASGFDANSGIGVRFTHTTAWENGENGYVIYDSTLVEHNIAAGGSPTVGDGTQNDNSWQRGGEVTFVSTDPASPDFLRPTDDSGFADIGAYVGL